jgi:hypothetical protein
MTIINFERYPLNNPAARAKIVSNAKLELSIHGSVSLPNFVTPDALRSMIEEANENFTYAHRRDMMLGFNPQDALIDSPSLSKRVAPYRMWIIGSDLLNDESPLRSIYQSAALIELIAEIVDLPELYCTADPLINVNVTFMGEGDQHGWHFDGNDFVASILLQEPESGGQFEYVPNATGLPIAAIESIFDETSPLTKKNTIDAGTLTLFRGRKALHRVAPVAGKRRRMVALLSYDAKPGFVYSETVRMNGLGRTGPLLKLN